MMHLTTNTAATAIRPDLETPFAIDRHGLWLSGWFALSAPIFMYWLLVHVSGVPPLEQQMLRSRGDAFRSYQSRVNVFFPFPSARQS